MLITGNLQNKDRSHSKSKLVPELQPAVHAYQQRAICPTQALRAGWLQDNGWDPITCEWLPGSPLRIINFQSVKGAM